MSAYRAQVASALDALELRSPRAYAWLGQVFEGPLDAASEDGSGPSWLERKVHVRLYGDFFLTGAPAPASGPQSLRLALARGGLTERLSAANMGGGAREEGWTVRRREGSSIVVARDGLELWAEPGRVIDTGAGTEDGAAVALLLPAERRGASEGFYTLLGDAGAEVPGAPVDRFYWNLRGGGGPPLVAACSAALNAARLPFRMKTVNDPRAHHRCDTAVLYTPRGERLSAFDVVSAVRDGVAAHLRSAVPALTLRLAPGVAFAEDPGGGESFGANRCRLIVDAAVAAWRAGERAPQDRMRRVVERFRREGVDLERPFLVGGPRSDARVPDTFA